MKIQSGKSYITFDGRSTGILKVNNGAAISFPYYSPELKVEYSESGMANGKNGDYNILEAEYSPVMIVKSTEKEAYSELERLKEENEAMRSVLKQNIQTFMDFNNILKSVEHKLPRELREYLNQ